MTPEPRRTDEILRSADDIFAVVDLAMKDLQRDGLERKLPALRNLAVFGAAFLRHVRTARGIRPQFDEWFMRQETNMTRDPKMRLFDQLATQARREREGTNLDITRLQVAAAGKSHGSAPRNAQSFFVGDRLGGTGWEVRLPDGVLEKYYVALPAAQTPDQARFASELDAAKQSQSVEAISRLYLACLAEVLQFAQHHLTGKGEGQ